MVIGQGQEGASLIDISGDRGYRQSEGGAGLGCFPGADMETPLTNCQ